MSVPNTRPNLPAKLKRDLLLEAGHRCAIPTCKNIPTDFAHIKPRSQVKKDEFSNMIVLCCNCHRRYDKEKAIDRKSMYMYKQNLSVINGKYSQYEIRLLHYLLEKNENKCLLYGREIDVTFLVKDGLIKEEQKKFMNSINFPPKEYILTKKGKKFIERWKLGKQI